MEVRIKIQFQLEGGSYAKRIDVQLVPGNRLVEVCIALDMLKGAVVEEMCRKLEELPPIEDEPAPLLRDFHWRTGYTPYGEVPHELE